MSYGPIKVFIGNIASGASTSTFTLDKAYSRIFVEIGTMSTAAAIQPNESTDGTTYYPIYETVNTATVQYQLRPLASGLATSGSRVPLYVTGPYVQMVASAVVSGGCTLKLICSD